MKKMNVQQKVSEEGKSKSRNGALQKQCPSSIVLGAVVKVG
jgi:hypothetical protein